MPLFNELVIVKTPEPPPSIIVPANVALWPWASIVPPVASVSSVMAFAVATPFDGVPKAGSLNGRVATSALAADCISSEPAVSSEPGS